MAASTPQRILRSLRRRGEGTVVTAGELVVRGFGTRAAVDQALSRLSRQGGIVRVSRGVYQLPQRHPRLGVLPPSDAALVRAVGASAPGVRVQRDGASAAHALGWTAQVPQDPGFLTTGRARRVRVGRRVVRFASAGRQPRSAVGTRAGELLVALRWMGPGEVGRPAVARALASLSPSERVRVLRASRHEAAWLRDTIVAAAAAG